MSTTETLSNLEQEAKKKKERKMQEVSF